MQNNPIVSVIIPVYKVENYIRECIKSIIEQDIKDCIQLILVDDCGGDNSFYIAQKYAEEVERRNRVFKFIRHDKNKGAGAARNTGIINSDCKYIMFVDSDDTIPPNAISTLYDNMINNPCDILDSFAISYDETGNPLSNPILGNSKTLAEDEIWEIGEKWSPVPWAKLIRTEFLLNNKLFFKENINSEDLHLSVKVALANPKIRILPAVTYNYIQRENSVVHTVGARHVMSYLEIFEDLYNILLLNSNSFTHNTKENYIRIFDKFRTIAIDLTFPFVTNDLKKKLFYGIIKYKPQNLFSILVSKKYSFKQKIKIIPLYCGKLGFPMINIKAKISSSFK